MLHEKIDLWNGHRYAAEGPDGFRPALRSYVLEGEKMRPAVLVLPGGGYGFTSPRESEPIALRLNAAGFHSFVLDYSVAPRRHPQPLLDACRAMTLIRENARTWKVADGSIAACGFSAGGHLAACLGIYWDSTFVSDVDGISTQACRPEALVLCYPVISAGIFAHRGSFDNLLGDKPGLDDLRALSLERQVRDETPPTFLWHTFEDDAVPLENSLLFARALREHGVPFELHVFPKGGHGLSLATAETDDGSHAPDPHVASWMDSCVAWLGTTLA